MKNLVNKMTGTMLIIFLICELFGFVPEVSAQDCLNSGNMAVKGNLSIGAIKDFEINSFHFGQTATSEFTITWKNDRLEILYGKETKPSEAVKQFFNWLKGYAESEFYIIRKTKLDSLLIGANSK